MSLLEHVSYKKFILEWIVAQPHGGRGQLKRMGEALRSGPVVMTQVFRGDRNLTLEQAVALARYLTLSELETEYFMLLVQRERSGSHDLSLHLEKQMVKIRMQSQQIRSRIKFDSFGEEARALFYSSWVYSAIRLGLAISQKTSTELAKELNIDRRYFSEVVDFLLKHGLLVKEKNEFKLGPAGTHIAHDHPLVERHHTNWRLKALESVDFSREKSPSELHYTGPMVLSKELAEEIRVKILKVLEEVHSKIPEASNEQVHCLTLDWFQLV